MRLFFTLPAVLVEAGDTLSAIALKMLGNAERYHEIFEANRSQLKSPHLIYPGQVLLLPMIVQ